MCGNINCRYRNYKFFNKVLKLFNITKPVIINQCFKGVIIKMTRTQVAPRHRPIHYYHIQGTKGFVETDRLGPEPGSPVQRGLLYVEGEAEHTQQVEWPEVDTTYPDYATKGGHGTSDYHTLLRFLSALDAGGKAEIDETRAWDMTVPGLIAAESAQNGGAWMDVPQA